MYKFLFMCYLYISSWIEVRGQIKNHYLFSNFHPIFFTSQPFQPFSPPSSFVNIFSIRKVMRKTRGPVAAAPAQEVEQTDMHGMRGIGATFRSVKLRGVPGAIKGAGGKGKSAFSESAATTSAERAGAKNERVIVAPATSPHPTRTERKVREQSGSPELGESPPPGGSSSGIRVDQEEEEDGAGGLSAYELQRIER